MPIEVCSLFGSSRFFEIRDDGCLIEKSRFANNVLYYLYLFHKVQEKEQSEKAIGFHQAPRFSATNYYLLAKSNKNMPNDRSFVFRVSSSQERKSVCVLCVFFCFQMMVGFSLNSPRHNHWPCVDCDWSRSTDKNVL